MSTNENEKITINLGVVDLAQIDLLVEQGIYSTRSDFIRASIRKQLEIHEKNVDVGLTRMAQSTGAVLQQQDIRTISIVGICVLKKRELESAAAMGQKMSISVVGMLSFDKDITPELFNATVEHVAIRGKLVASPEIKDIINNME